MAIETNYEISKESMKSLVLALKSFSEYVMDSSEDFSFEKGIVAVTDTHGIVLQFLGIDIDGNEHNLQLLNLGSENFTYASTAKNEYTELWARNGLSGGQEGLIPYFNKLVDVLADFDFDIDRLEWDMIGASNKTLSKYEVSTDSSGNYITVVLSDQYAYGNDEE